MRKKASCFALTVFALTVLSLPTWPSAPQSHAAAKPRINSLSTSPDKPTSGQKFTLAMNGSFDPSVVQLVIAGFVGTNAACQSPCIISNASLRSDRDTTLSATQIRTVLEHVPAGNYRIYLVVNGQQSNEATITVISAGGEQRGTGAAATGNWRQISVSTPDVCDRANANNCVTWLENCLHIKFPRPLNSYEDKLRIINSYEPKPGIVAVIKVAGSMESAGHVAYVYAVCDDGRIRIAEANYHLGTVGIREGFPIKDLCVIGYYDPFKSEPLKH